MRYAIISDIHGNLPALQAALEDARRMRVDGFLFAGDYYLGLPYPNEVVERLRELRAPAVRGNQAAYIERLEGQDQSRWTDGQMATLYWAARTLKKENREYLYAMPERLDFAEDGVNVHIAHRSQTFIGEAERRNFRSSMIPKRYGGAFVPRETFLRDIRDDLRGNPAFRDACAALEEGVYVFGHSHSQWHAAFDGRVFVNPGSCGVPLDANAPGAPYTILELRGGCVSVEERRPSYDVEGLIRATKESSLYEAAPAMAELFLLEVATRREQISFFLRYAEEYAGRIGDEVRPYSLPTWEEAYREWRALRGGVKSPEAACTARE